MSCVEYLILLKMSLEAWGSYKKRTCGARGERDLSYKVGEVNVDTSSHVEPSS